MAEQESRLQKAYLVDIRDMLIHFLSREVMLNGQDIADLFNINRSTVSRVLKNKSVPLIRRYIKKIRS